MLHKEWNIVSPYQSEEGSQIPFMDLHPGLAGNCRREEFMAVADLFVGVVYHRHLNRRGEEVKNISHHSTHHKWLQHPRHETWEGDGLLNGLMDKTVTFPNGFLLECVIRMGYL